MVDRPPKLFLGIGHLLRRDDGVGVRAAEIIAGLDCPPDLEVFDAGLAGWELATALERRALVVVVDAIDAGAEPGAVFRMTPEQMRPAVRSGMSLHDFHLLDALDETRLLGRAPERVIIFGIQPQDLAGGIGLTPAVQAGLDRTIPLVLAELGIAPARSAVPTEGARAGVAKEMPWTRK